MATIAKNNGRARPPTAKVARPPAKALANKYGVYVRNVTTVRVPMKKSWKAAAAVLVAYCSDGQWRTGYDYEQRFGNGGGGPSVHAAGFPSKKAAVVRLQKPQSTALASSGPTNSSDMFSR